MYDICLHEISVTIDIGYDVTVQIYSGITGGRVFRGKLHTHRIQVDLSAFIYRTVL